ncbi:ribonuclease R family protein [Sandaracinobacteroides saxicola]|uniref:Ribonuclease R n=1 Tax=Sandaracinobacteroides saxicola TaxID=2759707 RepID=A0A7G5IGK3_9SPHN|nr:VacB/RNase II family 3'-5' exoribonuclease [Sandaracinobacteroides saxicola]QMW22495.1 VacB/RNase II family 3'-5' exoribonuclease [Sandaracinobacteroides saxicola]
MSLPTRAEILRFIESAPGAVGKREIARAFGLHGEAREGLKALLDELADAGALESGPGRKLHAGGGLPRVTVLQVVEAVGERIFAVPVKWEHATPPPRVRVVERGRRGALGLGDRVLARIEGTGGGYTAHPMKKLAASALTIVGTARREGAAWRLTPVDKRARHDFALSDYDGPEGELLLAEVRGSGARASAHVVERLGDPFAPRSLSLIAISAKGIPHVFSDEVLAEAEAASRAGLGPREDLRALPLITIDPADARDHDDAVWAEADGDGWRLIVAIADVSWFVRSGTALDREAYNRGNSVYFPDRVVPMLPEALSAGACSLVEGEDRAVLACEMAVSADGAVISARFGRAVIRIVANIAYEDAQAAIDGRATSPLTDGVLRPLWGAWGALAKARAAREPLELDLPEKQVLLDEAGNIAGIRVRERLDAHRLIEDMMIAANVAAAKALEAKKLPCLFRDHEAPSREKLVALKEYLATIGLKLALGQVVKPALFNRFLALTKDRDDATEIAEQVLRSQTQAYYAPDNRGHFGLSLASYAHFTSPIRRYADLLVHRGLVRAFGLGEGGLGDAEGARFAVSGDHVSLTERRAMEAERETLDRYVASHLAGAVGTSVRARITGVTNFGFFATVDGIGGDGLVPMGALGEERFDFDEAARTLTGQHSGTVYRVGQRLELALADANPVSGALRFAVPGVVPREPYARGGGRRRDGRGGRGDRGGLKRPGRRG